MKLTWEILVAGLCSLIKAALPQINLVIYLRIPIDLCVSQISLYIGSMKYEINIDKLQAHDSDCLICNSSWILHCFANNAMLCLKWTGYVISQIL